jgi:pyridinium-3,5-bisthiocarboxylic acid mononucleotide nickel chelatase
MTAAGRRVLWLDCASGVSGDMLLGALQDLGALDRLPLALASLRGVTATVHRSTAQRGGLTAGRVSVTASVEQPARRLTDVLELLDAADVPHSVRMQARAVFLRLAEAEARVHGTTTDEVHFHEVGAVDAIVDVLGTCLGVHALGVTQIVVSPIALGGGTAQAAHGELPVPVPAVLELLRASALVGRGGPVDVELATPTGVALLAELADAVAPMPTMSIEQIGLGAGGRDLPGRANVVRAVVGTVAMVVDDGPADAPVDGEAGDDGWRLLEANVDDLDPRLWAGVLDALLSAGAADAWLTPVLMKKGRPAHTLAALTPASATERVRRTMFLESSTIGIRETTVAKHALERAWRIVEVDGQSIRVKTAHLDGDLVNATPEWDDVAAAAAALDRPAKAVLAAAAAAAHQAPPERAAPAGNEDETDHETEEPDSGLGRLTPQDNGHGSEAHGPDGGLGRLTPHDEADEPSDGGLGRLISRGPAPGM